MGKKQEKRIEAIKAKAAAQTTKPDPDEIIVFRGWRMSRYTAAAIKVLEEILGFELTLIQGPYNPGDVPGSAGSHDEDGVIDLASFRAKLKCTVSRRHSWASWIRPVNWDGQGGEKHLHQCLKQATPMAPLAFAQLNVAYPAHENGLADHAHDDFPVHPELSRFNYNEWWHDQLLEDQIKGVTARINRLLDSLSAARARRKRLRRKQKQNH